MQTPLIDLEKILLLSSVYIYWVDRNNIYQGCNEAFAIASGLSAKEEIVGKQNKQLPVGIKDPVNAANWDVVNLEIMESGERSVLEEAGVLMDGTRVSCISHKVPIKNNFGEVIGLLGISVDVTKQKLVEYQLQQDKEKAEFTLEYIIAHLPEHIYWKDKNGVYLGSNDKQAQSLGFQFGNELVGKVDFELPWGKKRAAVFRENDIQVMQSGIAQTKEEPSIVDGKPAVVLSHKVPLKSKAGKVIGIIGISLDITDRKNAEKLRAEKDMAEQLSRVLGIVCGSIAHEVRTPLSIVGINADGLQIECNHLKNTKQKTKLQKYISNIKLAVKSGSNIIDMLLVKFNSVFNMSKFSEVFKPSSIIKCINNALKEYPFYKNERQLIIWDEKKNTDFIYRGDNLLTKHILFNLIKNALHAIKERGSGKIYINLSADKKFNYLMFKDTGQGIPIDIIDSLFKEFSGTNRDGSGLGLVFCKVTMQSYGGNIKCNAEEGRFTEFVLSFPK